MEHFVQHNSGFTPLPYRSGFGKLLPNFQGLRGPSPRGFGYHGQEMDSRSLALYLSVFVRAFGVAILNGSREASSSRPVNDSLPLRRRDGEVKCSWETVGPGRDVNIGWAPKVVGSVVRALGEEQVRFLEFWVAACSFGKEEAFIAGGVVPAGPVATRAACSGVMAAGVQNLVAQGTPIVGRLFEHAQALSDLANKLFARNSQPDRHFGDYLPELLGPDLAL